MFDKASLQGAESTINWSLSLESITSRTLEGKGEGLAHSSVAGWLGMLMTVTNYTPCRIHFSACREVLGDKDSKPITSEQRGLRHHLEQPGKSET